MAIIVGKSGIFLHIPKTGGSWISEVLDDQGLIRRRIGHIHADYAAIRRHVNPGSSVLRDLTSQIKSRVSVAHKQRLRRLLRSVKPRATGQQRADHPGESDHFWFCFVRHPVRWYESFWRYMCKREWPSLGNRVDIAGTHPLAMLNGLGDDSFSAFIERVISQRPGFVSELYGWYDRPGMSFVGRQENLVDDAVRAMHKMGLTFDEARVRDFSPRNVTKGRVRGSMWDPDLLAEVQRLEAPALTRSGYEVLDF